MLRLIFVFSLCLLLVPGALAQARGGAVPAAPGAAPSPAEPEPNHANDTLLKAIDDLLWYNKAGDIAEINKVRFTGPPPRYNPNPTGQGAGNPMIIPAYTFIPRKLDRARKHPLVVLVHGGVHANFASSGANIVRELLEQGYVIIAPEYRGSTGYGGGFYRAIDYGALENDNVYAARNWASRPTISSIPSVSASWAGATAA